jgi:hypothetical protein
MTGIPEWIRSQRREARQCGLCGGPAVAEVADSGNGRVELLCGEHLNSASDRIAAREGRDRCAVAVTDIYVTERKHYTAGLAAGKRDFLAGRSYAPSAGTDSGMSRVRRNVYSQGYCDGWSAAADEAEEEDMLWDHRHEAQCAAETKGA